MLFRVAVIIAAKGGAVADITIGDVLEILSAEDGLRGKEPSGPATFRALREAGIFGDGIPTLREIRDTGQRTVGELVDRYPVACRPVRDLIVDYLRERQPSIDYVTLKNRAYELARCFWADLEQHHPGIDSLRLSPEMAAAWKQRLRTRTKTVTSGGKKTVVEVERLSCLDVMSSVRCFYLDLAEWALEDPARWGRGWRRAPSAQKTWTAARPSGGGRPGWTPAPGTACPSCRSWSPQPPVAQGRPGPAGRRPAGPAGRRVHRGRADAHPLGPAARRARQHLGPGPGQRPAPAPQPGGGACVLGMGRHRSTAHHRLPGRGADRTQPSQPGPVPAARHRRGRPAAADRAIEDRYGASHPCRPGARGRAQRRHLPDPRP